MVPEAHFYLGQMLRYTDQEPHFSQLRTAQKKQTSNNFLKECTDWGLFHAYDHLDQKDRAFLHLQSANKLKKERLGYDPRKAAKLCAAIKVMFNRSTNTATGELPFTPIFITGLPRSGTTLVERILTRDPKVQAAGELSIIHQKILPQLPLLFEQGKKSPDLEVLLEWRKIVIDGIKNYSDGSPVLIDKGPLNYYWIGFICTALPEAKIIHMNRDPMAVAWSQYKGTFDGRANNYIYDFSDIARNMAIHDYIMEHWHTEFPRRVHEVNYADLVNDTEATTKALAQATGLEWTAD